LENDFRRACCRRGRHPLNFHLPSCDTSSGITRYRNTGRVTLPLRPKTRQQVRYMPVPGNVAEFITVVRQSGLVAEHRLPDEVGRLTNGPDHCPATADQMAQALVAAGLLTRFQARQLKLGRHKRFLIAGKYRLLELLGVGGMGAVYLCEHVYMKRLVAL